LSGLQTTLALIRSATVEEEKRATPRRRRLPAAISPAPLLSGGRSGVGEGGGPRNRRADVYRLGCRFPRSRFGSPSLLGGGARSSLPACVGRASSAGSGACCGPLRRQISFSAGGVGGSCISGVGAFALRRAEVFCPLLFSGGVDGVAVGHADVGLRYVLARVHLSRLGLDFLCSPVCCWGSFLFQVGMVFVDGGFVFRVGRFVVPWWPTADCVRRGWISGFLLLLFGLFESCFGSQRRRRSLVVRGGSWMADGHVLRMSCGLTSSASFIVWESGEDGGVVFRCGCGRSTRCSVLRQLDPRKKKKDFFVVLFYLGALLQKRGSTVLVSVVF